MAKQTTRDAALSRLFGNVSEGVTGAQENERPEEKSSPDETTADEDGAAKEPVSQRTSVRATGRRGRGGVKKESPTQEAAPSPSGYIGMGRYSRSDGVVERITPYVRPDQAEALRIAVARKNDPRGTDVSQIIQALLDEAGYSG